MSYIECAGIIQCSVDDGPGVRTVLFLQGCNRGCKGCQNVEIQKHGEGILYDTVNLIKNIDKVCFNKKITISGGEPMEQSDALCELIEKLKKEGYNICLFTSWSYDQIPREILSNLDYIKTGEYISSLRDEKLRFVGSKNQKMYKKIKDNDSWEIMDLVV